MNKVELSGKVVGTPTVKEIGGSKILAFSVAVSESYTAKNGEKRDVVHYFDIEAVGQAASMSLNKGDSISLVGALKQDRWVSPSGEKRSRVKIVAFRIVPQSSEKKQTKEQKTVEPVVQQKQTQSKNVAPERKQQQAQTQKAANYKTYKKAA
jgi:single-strand DNA-binding protein